MSYTDIVIADIRLTVLQALAQDADYAQNENIIDAILASFGHNISRDQLRTQLAWLEEQGLLKLSDVGSMKVARLTQRGEDVAYGHAHQPGVRRPSPGE